MTDDRSHSLWLSTNPHPPISSSPTEAVLAQRTAHATGMSMRLLQHAHSRRSDGHSRSTRTTATPIHSLYSSHPSLTNAHTRSQQSRSSITRPAPSPLVRHHSTSTSSSGGNASATESFAPYTHMAGYFRQPSPAIPPQLASNYPVASLRSTSTSRPMGDNAPGTLPLRLTRTNSSIGSGVILVDSLHASSSAAGQVQRVDVKRLMSKPRAVLPPSSTSSHSILSFPAHQNSSRTHASASSSLSDDETADRKASVHPLTVGRRRRSRTMDELMLTASITASMSIPVRPPQVNTVTSSIMTPTTPTIPTYSDTLKPHQAAGPSFTTRETTTIAPENPTMADTPRPKEAINTAAAPIDYHMQRTTVWLDTPSRAAIPPARQAASLDLHRTSDLTPASALALAWNESQRQEPQPSPDSTSSQLPPPPPSPGKTLPLPPSQDVSDPRSRSSSYGHVAPNSFFDSSMRGGKVVAVGGPEEGVEDTYRMWAMVEEKLRQTSRTPTGGNPIKELRRRVTGRFSRGKDKNKEKERDRDKEKRAESMGALLLPSSYPTASSKPGVPQRRKTEFGPDRQPAGNLVIPNPRGSSLNALSSTVSWKSWGDATNASSTPAPEFGSFQSQVTPTGSTINVNRNEYTYSPQPSVPGSESSPTPDASLRMRSKSPAPSRSLAESGEGDTGRLWKLVRKLSNGALRQRLANEHGDSSVSAEDVPPVPALPKDFELVDHHAYISERNREHAQEKMSWVGPQRAGSLGPVENPGSSSSGTQSTITMQSPPLLSSKNEQLPIPVLPTSPPSTSPVSPPRSTRSKVHSLNVVANISALNPHPYPPRSKHASRMPAHQPSASQQSITTSGNATSISGHEFSFRSASPGFSSSVASDVTSSKVMTSPYSQRSSVSSSSELNTTAVAIVRHIIPPEELYRIRQEDSFAQQAHSDTGHGGAPSGRVQPRGPRIHIKHDNKSSVIHRLILSSPTSPPPPSSSPVVRQFCCVLSHEVYLMACIGRSFINCSTKAPDIRKCSTRTRSGASNTWAGVTCANRSSFVVKGQKHTGSSYSKTTFITTRVSAHPELCKRPSSEYV